MRKAITKEIETNVALSGNGAHVFVPKGWFGKRVKVILLDEPPLSTAVNEIMRGARKKNSNMRHINLDKNDVREFANKVIMDNKEVFDRLSKL